MALHGSRDHDLTCVQTGLAMFCYSSTLRRRRRPSPGFKERYDCTRAECISGKDSVSVVQVGAFSPVCFIQQNNLVPTWRQCHLLLGKHFDAISHDIYASIV